MGDFAARAVRILRQPAFAGVLACAFVLGLGHSFVSPFLSLWGTEEIGLSTRAFGLYMTATTLSTFVVTTLLARWSDTHVARRTMLLLGATGGVLGYTAYALLHDPRVLVVVGSTLLAVAGVNFPQIFAHTRERFFATQIPGVPPGFLMSIVRVCFSLAWTAGPSVGAYMMVQFGFRGLFLGAASLLAVFFAGVLFFVPHEPRSGATRRVVRESVWRVITRGHVLAMFVAFLLIFAAHVINLLNLPLVITQDLGGTKADVGIAFGMGPLAELPLMLWFGLLAARGHQLGLIRFGAAATVGYFLLLTLARAPWHVYPMQILHGLSFAIISNVAILFFQELVPGQPGLATAIFSNAANLGNLVGYLGFSLLAEPVGHRGMFLVSAALTAGTALLVFAYRGPRHATPPA